ncbi:hypothetical protein I6F33_34140 [Bradyrhizobium sp. BRP20]|uniref:hypothetical protein n=1 Tax=unclassified Bradyrhizobium TaxID=2631580 RepID=UPI001CD27605|nr:MULTISPECIES: hypothetical protein [unclassified Bradyrhizobium]MCA1437965.1 hypothetical protein [Bradyrhizobium sp. BRP20]MCA1552135.1 hypothetical protein [Bradyrhizobium sp. BRP19]
MVNAGLYPDERYGMACAIPYIEWSRPGRKECALVLFLTGGGHLGRISYGYPDGDPRDFLAYWLTSMGYNLVVPSPPIEHPVFNSPVSELDVTTWSEVLIDLVAAKLHAWKLKPRVLVVGWSMAGRFISRLVATASSRNIAIEAFVSLAATPPLPGLSPVNLRETPLSAHGFRSFLAPSEGEFTPLNRSWLASLSEQDRLEGRSIIPSEVYFREFVGSSPLNLHGEALRWRNGRMQHSLSDAAKDVLAMEFQGAPLCAAIIPTASSDRHHLLTDQANWSFFNAHVIAARAASFAPSALNKVRSLVESLPKRLSREAVGGHFFFVGAKGARAAAQAILALHAETLAVEVELKCCS